MIPRAIELVTKELLQNKTIFLLGVVGFGDVKTRD